MRQKYQLDGMFQRGGADLPFRYVPFEVPPGTKRIDVSYHFTRAELAQPEWGADDVVDIGIFDQRGTELFGDGFRGWSGSARRSFFITQSEATPGYIRGAIAPGTWHIFLGCRIINSEGMPYIIHISLDVDQNAAAAPGSVTPLEAPSR
ncbi:MAG TPA: phosphoesterase, partial [Dehalococcoidia bacterium]